MIRSLSRRIAALLLLPLLGLLLGCGTGGWHCSDGALCELPAALTCCCGCADGETVADHPTPAGAPTLTSAGCGCYYDGADVYASVRSVALSAELPIALPSRFTLFSAPVPSSFVSPPAVTESPPRYLVSSPATRGPPHA